MNLKEYIKSDLEKMPWGGTSFKDFIRWYFIRRNGEAFAFTFWYRVTWYVRKKYGKILSILPYLMMRHFEFKYGIHANAGIEIGKGLHIVHGDGVYLNCSAIGDNFTIYQGVTLGKGKGGIPWIGNNVTIFTNAVVVGNIRVADGAKIGANAFVTEDVGENEVIVTPQSSNKR